MAVHSHQVSSPASVRTVVPIVALVTTIVLQSIQSLVMQVRGARSGVGLTDVLMQWDSQWMTLISRYGYSGFAMGTAGTPGGEPIQWQSIAFFPGYPWVVRAVAAPVRVLSGAEITVGAAFTVSVVASVVLVWGLGLLCSRFLWPRVTGRAAGTIEAAVLTAAAGVLALGAPMSVVYFMAYSEAMFTALAVWIVYFLLGRNYTAAGILTCVVGLTRLTAVVLVVALVIAAVVEIVLQWRSASGAVAPSTSEKHRRILPAWASAGMSAVIGSLGIIGYISWANGQAAGVGGYFAAQERGWHSGFDGGRATWDWLTSKPSTLWVSDVTRYAEGTMPGYAISSWSMVVVAALCVASLWPLYTRRLPWQLWWPAIAMAGMTLGSAGVMHSRPRLLLLTVLFLLLPLVVSLVAQAFRACRSRRAGRHRWLPVATGVVIGVCWCVVGFWVSAEMLIGFRYAI